MHFSVYLPPQAKFGMVPVIYWLSGLTCTDDNFVQKSGAQQFAAEAGVAIVCGPTIHLSLVVRLALPARIQLPGERLPYHQIAQTRLARGHRLKYRTNSSPGKKLPLPN
jgi:hypothetical protein